MIPPGTEEQDAHDMAQLVQGQESALNRLMDRHATRVYQYLFRALQNEEDAADLAQETFARVYLNRARYNPSRKFTSWLYSIACNLVRDRFRWRSRHPQVSLDLPNEAGTGMVDQVAAAPESQPDEALARQQQAEAVRRAIAALPEDLRQPLILAVYEDLPQIEIARILDCSVKAVETRIYRARNLLRSSLKNLEVPEPG